MKAQRMKRVLEEMKKAGVEQMVITNPYAIYYLAEHFENPGERFWALLVKADGRHTLIANRLFVIPRMEEIEVLWYKDGEDGTALLSQVTDPKKPLGIDETMAARFLLPLMDRGAGSAYVLSSQCVDRVRARKDQEEMEKMRSSSAVNDQAMEQFKKLIHPGVTERQVADQLLSIYQSLGGESHSFPPIVAFGANAAVGHHEPDDTVLKPGDCVLFDVGCVRKGYCSDMTRTFFYGSADEEQKKVYETVKQAQLAAEAAIAPGVPLCDIDRIARRVIEEAGYGEYFTHRLGHFIGMEEHEKGDVSLASDLVAEPGMIFSIEPGIYLPGKVGVRIEDLVLVTEDGVEILNHYSKELEILPEA